MCKINITCNGNLDQQVKICLRSNIVDIKLYESDIGLSFLCVILQIIALVRLWLLQRFSKYEIP